MKKIFIILLAAVLLLAFAGCSFFDKEVELLVLLDEDLTDADSRLIATTLNTFPEAISVEYVTAEEAFVDFMDEFEDPSAFEGIDASLLRNRCIVTAKESDSQKLSREISKLEGVSMVHIGKSTDLTERMEDILN